MDTSTLVVKELTLVGHQFGNYKILSELGRGGMAIVYKADELSLNRVVALKVMSPQISQDEEMIKRFRREAQAVAKLNHPNIVHIYAIGEIDGTHYFTMEYVKGRTLRQMRKEGPIPLTQAIAIIGDAAQALDEAHKAGIVHRDIKPSNIMVDSAGRVKVMDFGLARMMKPTTQLTVDGTFLGTPEYMSPEQCEGKPVDGRTDIYSLGVTFYEILAGKVPFKAETPASMLVKIMKGEIVPLRQVNPNVPQAVEALISRMIQFDPERRFRNCGELIEALKKLGAQLAAPDEATQVSRVERGTRRKPDGLMIALAVPAVLALVGGALLIRAYRSAGRSGEPISDPNGAKAEAPAQAAVTRPADEAPAGTRAPVVTSSAPAPAALGVTANGETPAVQPQTPTVQPEASAGQQAEPLVAAVPTSPNPMPSLPATGPSERPAVAANVSPAEPVVASQLVPMAKGPVPEPAAAVPPPSNSVLVVVSGDTDRADALTAYIEAALPKDRFEVVDGDATQGKKASDVARYSLTVKASSMGTRTLSFYGSSQVQYTYTLMCRLVQSDSGKVIAGPFTRKVEFTDLNAEANIKEAVSDLVGELKKSLPPIP